MLTVKAVVDTAKSMNMRTALSIAMHADVNNSHAYLVCLSNS